MQRALNLMAVPAAKPFLDVLAQHVLARYGADPLELSRVLILLPSRRACRSLREAFLRASGGKPLLLPSIQPLGEVEEEELFFTRGETLAAEIAAVPPAIAPLRRLFLLAELIRGHYAASLTIAQALALAEALAELLDEIQREQVDMARLGDIVPAELAAHWQVTHEFLTRALTQWPQVLQAEGCEDGVQRRNRLLALLAHHWQNNPPSYPIIAAGSTGSIPAVAALLRVIAGLPDGMVVLSGLDAQADEAQWQALGESHPQWGLAQLLRKMGASRRDVKMLDVETVPAASMPARHTLWREALRPAETLPAWQALQLDAQEATQEMHYLTCRTSQEEANVIALLLRETLETPGKTAALVTRDRTLARRVAAQMQRFGIALNDSAGSPLATTPAACFLRLIAECAMAQASPITLLALLKHPFSRAGLPPGSIRPLVRQMEVMALRGVRVARGIPGLRHYIANHRTPSAELDRLLERLEEASAAFFSYAERPTAGVGELVAAHLQLAEWLATTETEPGSERLWAGPEGEQLAACMDEMAAHAGAVREITPALYPAFFAALLQRETFRPAYGLHPRLHVLSPLEARLQHFDRVILAGLNEGSWPPEPEHSPWLNRAMRRTLGLPVPEQRIGQAAHDFFMQCLGREVFLTRSKQEGENPAQASRWLIRLEALLHKLELQPAAPHPCLAYAQALDTPTPLAPIAPPAPCPTSRLRPKKLSVTDVERLMSDPYVIYAKHVLGLRRLDDIDMLPDAAHFGQFVHRAIEQFIAAYPTGLPDDTQATLLECGRKVFAKLWDQPVVRAYWWPRFRDIAAFIAEQEQQHRLQLAQVYGEIEGRLAIGQVTLTTRIDRLERARDGAWNIVDYKTGGVPSVKNVRLGIASQLPLEGLILQRGTWPEPVASLPREQVGKLSYCKLTGAGQEGGEIIVAEGSEGEATAASLIAEAEQGVRALLAAFARDDQAFHAVPLPEREKPFSDYDHLMRRAEWDAAA